MPEKRTLYLCLSISKDLSAEDLFGNKMKVKMLPGAFGVMPVYETLELLLEHEGEHASYQVLDYRTSESEDDNA